MDQHKNQKTLFYESFVVLECLLWGIGNPISKIGMAQISPFWCLALRFTLAFLIFVVFFGKRIVSGIGQNFKSCCIISFFNALAFILGNLALSLTSATIASFLMAISVVFTPVTAIFILKKKPNPKFFPFILIIVVGMYFLCGNDGAFSFGAGEIMALCCSASLAVSITYSAKYVSDIGPVSLAAAQSAMAAIMSFTGALIFEDASVLLNLNGVAIGSVIYLAVGCTVLAFLLQNYAIKNVSPLFVSIAFCTEPVFTAIAAYFMLDERLSVAGFIGAVLLVFGVVAASIYQMFEKD